MKKIEKIREAILNLIIPESECKGKPLTDIGRQYAYREILGTIDSMQKEYPANEELAKAVKDVLKDKDSAKKFLLSAGIMDADGKLAEPYRTEEPASEDLEEEIRKYFLAYKGYPHIMDKTEREMKKACIYFAN